MKNTLPSKSRASSQPAGSGSSELSRRFPPLSHGIASGMVSGLEPSLPCLVSPPTREKKAKWLLTAALQRALHRESLESRMQGGRKKKVSAELRPSSPGQKNNKRPTGGSSTAPVAPSSPPDEHDQGALTVLGPPCSPPPPYFIPPCPYWGWSRFA